VSDSGDFKCFNLSLFEEQWTRGQQVEQQNNESSQILSKVFITNAARCTIIKQQKMKMLNK